MKPCALCLSYIQGGGTLEFDTTVHQPPSVIQDPAIALPRRCTTANILSRRHRASTHYFLGRTRSNLTTFPTCRTTLQTRFAVRHKSDPAPQKHFNQTGDPFYSKRTEPHRKENSAALSWGRKGRIGIWESNDATHLKSTTMYSCVNYPRGCRGRTNAAGTRCSTCVVCGEFPLPTLPARYDANMRSWKSLNLRRTSPSPFASQVQYKRPWMPERTSSTEKAE